MAHPNHYPIPRRFALPVFLLLTLLAAGRLSAQVTDPWAVVAPVQTQLDAYNTGDLELFLSVYSDSIVAYAFPDQVRFTDKETMRQRYGQLFERSPDLQCRLISRMVMGDKVIDHESVVWSEGEPPTEVVAIYTVREGLITEVRFLRAGR